MWNMIDASGSEEADLREMERHFFLADTSTDNNGYPTLSTSSLILIHSDKISFGPCTWGPEWEWQWELRHHYHGINQAVVSDLVHASTGNYIRISGDASPEHWRPSSSFVLKLEASPGCWVESVALVFSVNRWRMQHHPTPQLPVIEYIVEHWNELKRSRLSAQQENHQAVSASHDAPSSSDASSVDGIRGRKWRRAPRPWLSGIGAATAAPVVVVDSRKAASTMAARQTMYLDDDTRGRSRRCLRRALRSNTTKDTSTTKIIDSSHDVQPNFDLDSIAIRPQGLSSTPGTQSIEAGWFIEQELKTSPISNSKFESPGEATSLTVGMWPFRFGPNASISHLPVLTVRPRFRNSLAERRSYLLLGGRVGDQAELDETTLREAAVARLDDFTGSIDPLSTSAHYLCISSITGDASVPKLRLSAADASLYWSRLSLFMVGDAGRRKLPCSNGRGLHHGTYRLWKTLPRYGLYDVDDMLKLESSPSPRWRAAWEFDFPPEMPACDCEIASSIKIPHSREFCGRVLPDGTSPLSSANLRDWFSVEDLPWEQFSQDDASNSGDVSIERCGLLGDWDSIHDASVPDPKDVKVYESRDIDWKEFIQISIRTKRAPRMPGSRTDMEDAYYRGLAYLVGHGLPKNIGLGLQWIVKAASGGSIRARAAARRLFSAYERSLDEDDETQRQWLLDGSSEDPCMAIQDLKAFYTGSQELQKALKRFQLSFMPSSWVLKYSRRLLPHLDLSKIEARRDRFPIHPNSQHSRQMPPLDSDSSLFQLSSDNEYWVSRLIVYAFHFGFEEALDALIAAGIDISKISDDGEGDSPLRCALSFGHANIARALIQHGAACSSSISDYLHPPSLLHYLVNITDDGDMSELADLLVAHGAGVNDMCFAKDLGTSSLWHTEAYLSMTPLRWAVMHEKPTLVKKLLQLGARFATSPHFSKDGSPSRKLCLLLEVPCTNLDILTAIFHALERGEFALPLEFSQTPLGLLLSENDSPRRRLRFGFSNSASITTALDVLLTLQPGFEPVVLWSTIRYGHFHLVEHLILGKRWDVQSRWRGLTCLHTAVLYGRADIVKLLLAQGACPDSLTQQRGLTNLQLLMLVRRDEQTDVDLFESLCPSSAQINMRERYDGLTAFHLAVRNQKMHLIPLLLGRGADPYIPVRDQLDLLAEGRSGCLRDSTLRPRRIVQDTTILGEVLLQYHQDGFYSISFVEELLRILLTRGHDACKL
ncbi:hypothetical protein CDV36_014637 [Fusarium kuroshium]|uniref:Uncharacterized protein n=1 Tax=Fusarium kuroshium TaxID=2010991 RepID=A0A3M2RH98_9HYPO|nr:hypothetical protein CDV36_014637 [Fusarium kuroshium]